jgi:hypothetical protein
MCTGCHLTGAPFGPNLSQWIVCVPLHDPVFLNIPLRHRQTYKASAFRIPLEANGKFTCREPNGDLLLNNVEC